MTIVVYNEEFCWYNFFIKDPAVMNATRTAPKTNVLEEYNPFEDDNPKLTNNTQSIQPPPLTQNQSFPAYTNQNNQINSAYSAPQISTDELQVQETL